MAPGYKHIIIQPHPSNRLDYSKATFESSYGTIESGWERKDGKIIVRVKVPANTTATIILPVEILTKITEGGKPLSGNAGLSDVRSGDNKTLMKAGSGDYIFEIAE
jgi:alpha-L-rhamnosidase